MCGGGGGGIQVHPLCGHLVDGDVGNWMGAFFEVPIPSPHIDPGIYYRGVIGHEKGTFPCITTVLL